MPIVQISRIQHRRGKNTDLPQLAAGELGWVIDDQRLYIGNGTVSDGAPAVGNTEIVTAGRCDSSRNVNTEDSTDQTGRLCLSERLWCKGR